MSRRRNACRCSSIILIWDPAIGSRCGISSCAGPGTCLAASSRGTSRRSGSETVLIKGDEARLTFRRDAAPRLAGLQVALEAVQFEADVRRAVPLSLRLRRLGGESIGPGLVRALTAVLRDHHRH